VHFELPGSEYLPAPHGVQLKEPGSAALKFASQDTQADEFVDPSTGFFLPAAQALQSFTWPTPFADEYVPAGQFLHEPNIELPSSLLYLPLPHAVHDDAPATGAKYPDSHVLQDCATLPWSLYRPMVQSWHS
jgi:hypothetical protein